MTAVTGKREQLALEEPRLRASQFIGFVWLVATIGGATGVIELILGFAGKGEYLYMLALLTLGLGIIAFIAGLLARSNLLSAGVYVWGFGSSLSLGLVPLIVTGFQPLILVVAVGNLITVTLFLSPRVVVRAALSLAVLALASMMLELWGPPGRPSLVENMPVILLIFNPFAVVSIAFLIRILGNTLLRAVDSARMYSGQLEQNQAALLERTASLEEVMATLRLRSEELEDINLNWQATSQQAEHRAAQLAASAQVAHAIGQVRDLDQLLSQVTQFISQAFGYYHVGVFIVDEIGEFAVLRAASSEGGQRMLARGHRLAVGKQGIVGYVTGTGQPRIALDAGADAVHFDNPDLPQTRSEMALPLRVGDQVIGALDVQSTQEAAFTEDDVAVLGTLADQIAVAIENARLFAQARAALREAEQAQQRYQSQEWERLTPLLQASGHEYCVSGVLPVGDVPLPEIDQVIQQGEMAIVKGDDGSPAGTALAVPIKLRDQLIGVIDLHEADPGHEWTDDDVALVTAVADQAALALENARLFAQTQRRAQREQLIAQVSAQVRAAPDVDGVLRTTVHQVRRALGASHGVIRLGMAKEEKGEYDER